MQLALRCAQAQRLRDWHCGRGMAAGAVQLVAAHRDASPGFCCPTQPMPVLCLLARSAQRAPRSALTARCSCCPAASAPKSLVLRTAATQTQAESARR